MTKLCSMFAEMFKEFDWIHPCPASTTTHQREEWTHWPHHAVVTDMEDRDSNDEYRLVLLIIYLEDSNYKEDDTPPVKL